MRRAILALIFCVGCVADTKANDTLTRREIYNFEIGDTFVYKWINDYAYFGIYNVWYTTDVVNDKIVSPNADTIIYVINEFNLVLTQLDSFEIMLQCRPDTLTMCSHSFGPFNGTNITQNTISMNDLSGRYFSFGKGLGKIYDGTGGYDFGFHREYMELIYFSKDTVKWGTLYSGIEGSGNASSDFFISPNPVNNSVIISIDESMIGSTITIHDIMGRMIVEATELQTTSTKFETVGWASGVYLATLTNRLSRGTKKIIINK